MWKIVKTTVGEIEARLLERLLSSHGIPVMVQRTDLFVHPIFGSSVQCELLVPEERLSEAMEIVEGEGKIVRYTPLYEDHVRLGAKIVEFAGFYMPLQYEGIVQEVQAVRTSVGMFDVSHMGEFLLEGADATRFVDYLVTNDFESLRDGNIVYTAMCNENGGFVDDLLAYKFSATRAMLVVNAANIEKDLAHISRLAQGFDVTVRDVSEETGLIAVQGPEAERVLAQVTDVDPSEIAYYSFRECRVAGVNAVVSRTGYTGEDGFEIYIGASETPVVWRKLLELGVKPAGLGARDVLRLEAGLLLYGNDMDETVSPLEAGVQWVVKFEKPDFYGKNALLRQRERGLARKLRGAVFEGKLIPRHGMEVLLDGTKVGTVTSGTFSPTLGRPIAFVMVDASVELGATIEVQVRDKLVRGSIVKTPFHRGSVKSRGRS